MKVIYTLFNQASGKLAGIVAAHLPRGGNYTRERVIPKNPRTAQQSRIRAIMASLSAAWTGTLDTDQRDGWNALGGGGPQGTGQNLFTAGNAILLQAGGTRVDDAPTGSATATFTPPAESDVFIVEGDNFVNISHLNETDDWQLEDGGVLNIYVSPRPQPEAHESNAVGLTYAGSQIVAGSTFPDASAYLPGNQTARFGQVWYVRLVSASADGKKSQDATYRVLVTPSFTPTTVTYNKTTHTLTATFNRAVGSVSLTNAHFHADATDGTLNTTLIVSATAVGSVLTVIFTDDAGTGTAMDLTFDGTGTLQDLFGNQAPAFVKAGPITT